MDLQHSSTFLNFPKIDDINSYYIKLLKYLNSVAVSFPIIISSLFCCSLISTDGLETATFAVTNGRRWASVKGGLIYPSFYSGCF